MPQKPTQINLSPIAVAEHYLMAADFWETQAKILRSELLAVKTDRDRLKAQYEPETEENEKA